MSSIILNSSLEPNVLLLNSSNSNSFISLNNNNNNFLSNKKRNREEIFSNFCSFNDLGCNTIFNNEKEKNFHLKNCNIFHLHLLNEKIKEINKSLFIQREKFHKLEKIFSNLNVYKKYAIKTKEKKYNFEESGFINNEKKEKILFFNLFQKKNFLIKNKNNNIKYQIEIKIKSNFYAIGLIEENLFFNNNNNNFFIKANDIYLYDIFLFTKNNKKLNSNKSEEKIIEKNIFKSNNFLLLFSPKLQQLKLFSNENELIMDNVYSNKNLIPVVISEGKNIEVEWKNEKILKIY